MNQLLEIRHEIERIRAAVDGIEVKGAENRTLATYAFEKCSTAIGMLDRFIKNAEGVNEDAPDDQ